MTEEEIRAIIASAFHQASLGSDALCDPERNIQVDTAMGNMRDVLQAAADTVAIVPTP